MSFFARNRQLPVTTATRSYHCQMSRRKSVQCNRSPEPCDSRRELSLWQDRRSGGLVSGQGDLQFLAKCASDPTFPFDALSVQDDSCDPVGIFPKRPDVAQQNPAARAGDAAEFLQSLPRQRRSLDDHHVGHLIRQGNRVGSSLNPARDRSAALRPTGPVLARIDIPGVGMTALTAHIDDEWSGENRTAVMFCFAGGGLLTRVIPADRGWGLERLRSGG